MLRSALEGEQPVLFSAFDPLGHCVFCGRRRPIDVVDTWFCSKCKPKSLWELIWKTEPPAIARLHAMAAERKCCEKA